MKRALWVYFLSATCFFSGFLIGMTFGPMPNQPEAWIIIMFILTAVFAIATGISIIYDEVKGLEQNKQ